jgi:hypothetical protein
VVVVVARLKSGAQEEQNLLEVAAASHQKEVVVGDCQRTAVVVVDSPKAEVVECLLPSLCQSRS